MVSLAEHMAMALDGEIVLLGDGALHTDRLVTARERLLRIPAKLKPVHIVSDMAAAWVHGVAPEPAVIDLAVLRHRRADAPLGTRVHIRSVRLDQCEQFGQRSVTGPLRTTVDLLALPEFSATAQRAVQLLDQDYTAVARAITVSGRAHPAIMKTRLDVTLRR